MVKDMYIDTLSLRNQIPKYADGNYFFAIAILNIFFLYIDATLVPLRVLPSLQMVYNTLVVTRDQVNKVLTISFRPNNCTINLSQSQIRQTIAGVSSVHLIFK